MASSKAIYSEVVDILLTIDNFKRSASDAVDAIDRIHKAAHRTVTMQPVITQTDVNNLRAAARAVDELTRAQERANRETMRALVDRDKQFVGYRKFGAAGPRTPNDYTLDQRTANAQRAATDYLRTLGRVGEETERAGVAQLARQERIRMAQLSAVEQTRAAYARLAVNRELDAQRELAHLARVQALRATTGHRVGSFASGARVGAALDIAAGAGFALGGTNIGASIYMLERLAYATGVGQKSLGSLAEKFGLVKLSGDGADASIARFGNNIVRFSTAIAAAATPLVAMFAGNKLNNQLADMSTLLLDASVQGREFASVLNDTAAAAARVSDSFGVDIIDVVKGFKTALSTGVEANQLEEFGKVASTVARGLSTTFDDAVGILTTFKDAYALSIGELSSTSDILFNAINYGKFQVDDLRNNIGRVVTSSAEAGVSVEDLMSGLATLTRVGMTTSQSITSLNRLIQGIVNPTAQARAQFEALGLATGHAALKSKTLFEYLAQMRAVVGNDADTFAKLFTTEQGRRGAIGLTANLDLTHDIRGRIDESGTATVAASRAMDTFSQNVDKVWSSIWNVVKLIGSDLLNVANDVFFPGGPLSSDNMLTLKNTIEAVGVAIKVVTTVLIGGLGIVINLVSALFNTLWSVALLLRGNFTEAGKLFASTWSNAFMSVVKTVTSLVTTVSDSVSRMESNVSDAFAAANEDLVASSRATAAEVRAGYESVFSDDLLQKFDTFTKAATNKWEALAEAIKLARFEAAKAKFDTEYSAPSELTERRALKNRAPAAAAEQRVLDGLARGQAILDKYKGASNSSILGGAQLMSSAFANDPTALDPRDKTWADLASKIDKARLIREQEEIGRLEAEARIKAYRDTFRGTEFEAMVEKQFAATPKASAASTASEDTLLQALQKIADALASAGADKPRAVTKWGYSATTDDYGKESARYTYAYVVKEEYTLKQQILEIETLLMDARRVYTEEASKGLLTEERRKATVATIASMETELVALKDKQAKDEAAAYAKQYDNAKTIHDLKVSLIKNELKQLDALATQYDDFITKVREARAANRDNSRSADSVFRTARTDVESSVERARRITDPVAAMAEFERIMKRIDDMVTAGKSAGYGDRAARFAEDFMAQIEHMAVGQRTSVEDKKQGKYDAVDYAVQKFKADMATNPVAQAAIAQATVVMREVMTKAAENGIGVSGDLVQTIDIGSIGVNIPVERFKTMVKQLVEDEIVREYRKAEDNSPKANDNDDPVGAGKL